MSTALISHPDSAGHVTPPGHPEQLARIDAVMEALEDMDLLRLAAPMAAEDDLLRAHPKSYVESLRAAAPEEGWHSLDADTHMSPGTLAAAWRGAGAAVRAVDAVLGGEADNAFCAMRPPGHHAERETAMGFCLLGNAAIAALHALDHHGLSRVAILDFDVHHGNGTQDLVEGDPRILFASTHQMPLYPGTGDPSDSGPHGTVINVALREGDGSTAFRAAWERILPRVEAHRPELIVISAGFDAHRDDPLASLELRTSDFQWVTGAICDMAERVCGGKVVSLLEGGYDLDALADGVRAHVSVLMERGG
ncbi:histone deacetylase family protein [Wenxinia saemankumensis]|uniref:Acetoin utilization deacetylase AcuC n=1 Tax=Wenxinia saemankumensis TaxID=1447782 RepID=A0A1M6FQ46_9RHOB|nr:histone deacetylase family protein [Wenxinia saemankumensis]SHI99794.1 Acetoin utilization deacetylase AcuC [Wenxinia saemankumensis]